MAGAGFFFTPDFIMYKPMITKIIPPMKVGTLFSAATLRFKMTLLVLPALETEMIGYIQGKYMNCQIADKSR